MKTELNSFSATKGEVTLVQALIVVALVAVFMLIVFVDALSRATAKASRITCNSHLKQLGLAYRLRANDNGGSNLMVISTNIGGTLEYNESGQVYRHYLALSNELATPKVLFCPNDTQRTRATSWDSTFGNQNISYFVGLEADETKPQMILSGDRNITGGVLTNGNVMLCKSNTVLSWTEAIHNKIGNVSLADGSVHQLSDTALKRQLQAEFKSVTNQVIRFAIP
jgi:competence protein ComGC